LNIFIHIDQSEARQFFQAICIFLVNAWIKYSKWG